MKNATMYCLCIHNKVLPIIKKLEYVPVGLGNDNFSEEWLRDNTEDNISLKISESTFFSSVSKCVFN